MFVEMKVILQKKTWFISWVTRWVHYSPTKTLRLWTKPAGCPCTPPLKDILGSVLCVCVCVTLLHLSSHYSFFLFECLQKMNSKKEGSSENEKALENSERRFFSVMTLFHTYPWDIYSPPLSINTVYPYLK